MTAGGAFAESEVKIPVPGLGSARRALVEAGAASVTEVHLERNVLFDDAAGSLFRGGRALRVRRARGRALMTFKGPASFAGGIKTREEIEVGVGDADALERILDRLGFVPRFRYEKRREEFSFHACVVALDETPIGCFVEVEGPPADIADAVERLGLRIEDAIRDSYASLYLRARDRDSGLPSDMIFPGSQE